MEIADFDSQCRISIDYGGGGSNAIETFESVEVCMPRLADERPGMFLLDVSLPGMDGYSFCRQIKDDPSLRHIPVTFVSGHDDIDARLAGYDAGGEDFVVKPFDPDEIKRKIKVAQHTIQNQKSLQEQAEASEYLSSLALASMDEAGIVLQFMSKLIGWSTASDVAGGLLELMQRYRLVAVFPRRLVFCLARSDFDGLRMVERGKQVGLTEYPRQLSILADHR